MDENYNSNQNTFAKKYVQWLTCAILLLVAQQGFSQSFNYQAAVRDAEGNPIANQDIGVQITVLQGNATGTNVYEETHTIRSNAQGIITLSIGQGNTSDNFSTIEWSTQNYWLQVAIDTAGGSNYTVLGASQLQSVPYANYATNGPDADPTNEIELPTGGINGQVLATDGNGNYNWIDVVTIDGDADPTNEIELPTGGTNGQVLITDGSGNYSWVNDNVNDADADPTNEIELPVGGTNGQVLVTDGSGNYSWVNDNINDADADATNEIELPTGGTNGQVLVTDGSGNYSWVNDNINDADADATNEIELPTGGTNGQVLVTDGSGNYSWVNDNINDADADATNEIELPTGGTNGQVLVTDGSGNYSWVNDNINDADADATNEIELPTGGTNGQVLSTDGSGNYSWVNDTQGAFSTTSNVTSNANGTIATDDFVFGSSQLDNDNSTFDDDYRMFFDKSEGAFRAGIATGDQWDTSNVGFNSIALGFDNEASGGRSLALGTFNSSTGIGSITIGNDLINAQAGQVTLGQGNTIDPSASNGIGATSRLFVIGNGTDINRSDALVMLKNGSTTLNGPLTIDGDNQGAGSSYTLPAQDGTTNQIMTTDGSGQVSWTNLPTAPTMAFSTTNNVTSNTNGTIATDDFVFGSSQLNNIGGTADDIRMYFDKSKGSFRAGSAVASDGFAGDWDEGNSGDFSVAMGRGNLVQGTAATAFGSYNNSGGENAFSVGYNNLSSRFASISLGANNSTSGNYAVGIGRGTQSTSYGQHTIGLFSEFVNGNDAAYIATDPLFIIGNGIDDSNRTNALVMSKNGNTTLNGQLTIDADNNGSGAAYTLPAQDGTTNQVMTTDGAGNVSWTTALSGAFSTTANVTSNAPGAIATDDFVFGSTQLDNDPLTTDDNAKMFFDKSKAAFRVGRLKDLDPTDPTDNEPGDQWNDANVGEGSIALGEGSIASARNSIAIGENNVLRGNSVNSIAIGSGNDINNSVISYAIGQGNTLTEGASMAFGFSNTSSAFSAIAMGFVTHSGSYAQTSMGLNNTVVDGTKNSFNATDRLFVIGNGVSVLQRRDALVMLKNGNTTLNGQFTIDADNTGSGRAYTLPAQDGTANQVMTTDGSGNASWANVAGLPSGGTNGQILGVSALGVQWLDSDEVILDNSPTNEIELPAGGAANSLLTTDGSGNRSWTNDVATNSVTTSALTVTGLPSFSADLSGTLVLSGAGNFVRVPSWRTSDATLTNLHDNGNHFDEASGTFTAPVNGLYFFSAQIRFDGVNSGDFRLLLGIQNKLSLDNGMHAITQGDAGTNFHTLTVSGVMKLNAGEQVNVNVQSSTDTSWSLHSESGFSGYLISRF
ncbi:C1q-like domain-containing protein [Aquimarina sp. 2304DJ70-9]|uniref:C1q-like domain-containing protein n=1 Tax=Aquimarina penaris TaxID=3231044 RepID=UPI003462D387